MDQRIVQVERVHKVTPYGNQFEFTVEGETLQATVDGLPFNLPRNAVGGATNVKLASGEDITVWWDSAQVNG